MKIELFYEDEEIKQYLPIFATKEFLSTKSSEYGWFVGEGFILPFYIDRRGIFSKLVFTNETICINNECNEILFLNRVIKEAQKLKIDMIGQPLASVVFNSVPEKAKFIKWGSYVVDLSQNEEELLRNMHSKHRNVIRKAIKDGVEIQETNDENIIFKNLKETMMRLNRPFPSLEGLKKIKQFSKFFIALKDGKIQGCAVLPYNIHGAYYLYGGSIAKPYTGSLNYMHYYAMLKFKKENVKQYDFMGARINVQQGSKLEGIQRFKSRFGGELKEGFLWKYIYNPYKVDMIYIIQKIRYRLKGQTYLGDAIDQESGK